ncbi:MAG: 8-oxoguanine DNA glycosylase, N-terminal domain-containing protein, partial [Clostridia bacterium]|nr:8-oxoguanine DNA glycosylase, N-terminal domain-containing protein [Clostridia bacterium]
MQKIDFNATYFNPKDVLECGQTFRFERFKDGYFVNTGDKACYVYTDGKKTVIKCDDPDYFYNYFDLGREYAAVIEKIRQFNVPVL